jgi:hypothetical protein
MGREIVLPSMDKTSSDKAYWPPECIPCGVIFGQLKVAGARIEPREIGTNMGLRELKFPFFNAFFLLFL